MSNPRKEFITPEAIASMPIDLVEKELLKLGLNPYQCLPEDIRNRISNQAVSHIKQGIISSKCDQKAVQNNQIQRNASYSVADKLSKDISAPLKGSYLTFAIGLFLILGCCISYFGAFLYLSSRKIVEKGGITLQGSRTIIMEKRAVTLQGAHTITVTPWGPDQQAIDAAKARVTSHPNVQRYIRGTLNRMLSFDFIENDNKASGRSEPPTRFRATIFNYNNNRSVIAEGGFYDSSMSVSLSNVQPNPTPDEFDAAVAIVAADPFFGPAITNKKYEAYPPMPPLSTDPTVKGKYERTVTVGLFPADDKYSHEIVGVNMVRRTVVRYGSGAPTSSNAAALNCGVPSAGQATTSAGVADQSEIVVSRDGTEFWRFLCIRPSASSGSDRSGIELRDVRYKGKMVLSRASAPILNVQYERNSCDPFRDWLWQEGMFDAPGTDVAPGIRMCSSPPGSVLDTGSDFGNFRGVAIWDREDVRLVSEMNAGWYRYISEWRFYDDGVIEPLFGYGATTNTCVCRIHTHHVYWRLDFDMATAANNNVFENKAGTRKQLETEVMQLRDGANQTWVVENSVTGEAVIIEPGFRDGNADKYGVGDVWLLRNRFPLEIDDSGQPANPPPHNISTAARLIPMVNGESISNQDVVVWYAGHWRHNHFEGPIPGGPSHGGGPNMQGPKLRLQKY